ncbi:unnamed protein product [Prorocentrum cordatum]|uniref:MAPEG family protein n=1 Tax=Prorocentrum cordatum TaxID=2364126 RepID=A0ABN9U1F1_9DINO|nr:unnamed protein product [Polarella glacialis]
MIPVVVALCGTFLPEWLVAGVMSPIPFRASPYLSLVYGVALVYLPFGICLIYKGYLTAGKIDNLAPRKQSDMLAATYPAYARLIGAEKNMQEGFPLFAAAVLAALQAGVAKDTVSLFATAWLVFRGLFIVLYAIQFNAALAALRSLSFGFSLALTTKLMYLAAAA